MVGAGPGVHLRLVARDALIPAHETGGDGSPSGGIAGTPADQVKGNRKRDEGRGDDGGHEPTIQPLADGIKMITKEDVIPEGADRFVFMIAPAVVATTALLMFAVVPFGVLAALYLREYAKQGFLVSVVRIAVNNLAGVPSIVFGVFGAVEWIQATTRSIGPNASRAPSIVGPRSCPQATGGS